MPALPIKESSRGLISEAARVLKPHFPEITAAWRSRMFEEFPFDGRVMAALERLNLGTGLVIICQADFNSIAEVTPKAFDTSYSASHYRRKCPVRSIPHTA